MKDHWRQRRHIVICMEPTGLAERGPMELRWGGVVPCKGGSYWCGITHAQMVLEYYTYFSSIPRISCMSEVINNKEYLSTISVQIPQIFCSF